MMSSTRDIKESRCTLLHYFRSSGTPPSYTCPVCHMFFTDGSQFPIHVNACLAAMFDHEEMATSDDSAAEDETEFMIRGLWSCQERRDVAPGLHHDESVWFEPKSPQAVPYYKWLAGTQVVVDAFSYGEIEGCEAYLLSHFHADHYKGLDKHWTHGPIYCSEITARLVEIKLGVWPDFLHPLPLNVPCTIIAEHVTVTLIDAHHCPGAVAFFVQYGAFRYLHTGDFRACRDICLHPMLRETTLDIIYLDTTYLEPRYSFPSQHACVQAACDIAKRYNGGVFFSDKKSDHWFTQKKQQEIIMDRNDNHRLLVIVGTYMLGKETIFIAKTLNSKIFVTEEKRKILNAFQDEELDKMLTNDTKEAQVHVIPLGHIDPEKLEAYYNSLKPCFTQMIAFKPTGWTYLASTDPQDHHQQQQQQQHQLRSLESIIKARTPDLDASTMKPSYETPEIKIYNIPYSEHSSFRELALFIASLDVRRIVPTVHVDSKKSREKMSLLLDRWAKEKSKLNGGIIKVVKW